jgi:hypothetical protein
VTESKRDVYLETLEDNVIFWVGGTKKSSGFVDLGNDYESKRRFAGLDDELLRFCR